MGSGLERKGTVLSQAHDTAIPPGGSPGGAGGSPAPPTLRTGDSKVARTRRLESLRYKPVLKHIRKLVHAACPDVEETLKWSMPFFMHKGILCSMAAFKQHCTFGFWKGSLIFGKDKGAGNKQDEAMGQFGRISAISDLPKEKVSIGYIKKAVRLNETGVRLPPRTRPKESKQLIVPADLMSALKENKKTLTAFENFSYSHKKEYVDWIAEAKGEETRKRRLATAIEWMAEGKSRHWKHVKC